MLANGFPLAPVMAFLTASPLMSPYVLITTWGILGPQMALVRLATALILAVICGLIIKFLTGKGKSNEWAEVNPALLDPSNSKDFWAMAGKKLDPENKGKAAAKMMWGITSSRGNTFSCPLFWVRLGGISASWPDRRTLGAQNRFSILWGPPWGSPFISVAERPFLFILSLMEQGMDKGSALAFFIVGPATRVSPMVTLLALVRKKPSRFIWASVLWRDSLRVFVPTFLRIFC